LTQDVELVGEVLWVVSSEVKIGVISDDVNIAASERDQVPEIKVDEAIGIHEELGIRNFVVYQPSAIVFVLNSEGCSIVESTTSNSFFGPLVELRWVCEKFKGLGGILAKGLIESGEVSCLALTGTCGSDV
jgi:hypothetical protein